MKKEYEIRDGIGNANTEYKVYSNNCFQQSLTALKKGKLISGTNVDKFNGVNKVDRSRPNLGHKDLQEIFMNTAYTQSEYHKQLKNVITENQIKLKSKWRILWKLDYMKNISKARKLLGY